MAKNDSFQATFETLRRLLKPYEKRLTVIKDKPGAYYLASKQSKTRTGSDVWFGGVEIKKNYVSFHFIPIYASPALRDELSPSLRKRMQGKSCFNFTTIDPAHVEELEGVAKKGFAGFIQQYP
jgi:hypothetical protein